MKHSWNSFFSALLVWKIAMSAAAQQHVQAVRKQSAATAICCCFSSHN